ncbi:hypothetical protein FVE85_9749 [Porphyridium purpureum]|uniref:DNA-directed RNA polymerase I subunit rpa49 n=1 Tax=Porphyridium purpureum TaxID=35688 RepID=A0A5J4YL54_PORPP|nr:hypothetical protein FVE85_9749 [Porphyridium purpureum]|eukprot:POR9471..scf246_12
MELASRSRQPGLLHEPPSPPPPHVLHGYRLRVDEALLSSDAKAEPAVAGVKAEPAAAGVKAKPSQQGARTNLRVLGKEKEARDAAAAAEDERGLAGAAGVRGMLHTACVFAQAPSDVLDQRLEKALPGKAARFHAVRGNQFRLVADDTLQVVSVRGSEAVTRGGGGAEVAWALVQVDTVAKEACILQEDVNICGVQMVPHEHPLEPAQEGEGADHTKDNDALSLLAKRKLVDAMRPSMQKRRSKIAEADRDWVSNVDAAELVQGAQHAVQHQAAGGAPEALRDELPPHDPTARHRMSAYPLAGLIGEQHLADVKKQAVYVLKNFVKKRHELHEKYAVFSPFTMELLSALLDKQEHDEEARRKKRHATEQERVMACMHLDNLLLLQAAFEEHEKKTDSIESVAEWCNRPVALVRRFCSLFFERRDHDAGRLRPTSSSRRRFTNHVLVSWLIAKDFRGRTADIEAALSLTPAECAKHLKHLGCQVAKGEFKLSVPLTFPAVKLRHSRG